MDWENLEAEIGSLFPGAEFIESFSDRKSWTIQQSSLTSIASAFQKLEDCKEKLIILIVFLKIFLFQAKSNTHWKTTAFLKLL